MTRRSLSKFWLVFVIFFLALIFVRAQRLPAAHIVFRDVTRAAGIHFVDNNGAFGKKWLPEALGPGVAFLDYNNDGWQDILLINGKNWRGHSGPHSTMALYRNNRNGTFTDVTRQAGLAVEMYGMGVAVGDYDNDGCDDIFVTALGQSHLFHNNCNGTFTDVTKKAGLWGPNEFSTSAAWVDFDRDGDLDLLAANYVQWTPKNDIYCTLDGTTKSYCTPEAYHGTSLRLWRNNGDGTFTDVTHTAGLYDPTSKSLGITVLDADQNGWPDIFVSNDTEPNKLYMNNGNGTFTEKAVMAGVGFSENGIARAGMGTDAADYDRSDYPSILITNFSNQMLALYHNERNGLFVDQAPNSEIGHASLLTLGFGCFFFDYDNDGWPDIFVANGHIDPDIEKVQRQVRYAEPPLLFRNLGDGKFANVTSAMGPVFDSPRVARGAAYGDAFNDGKLDILLSTNDGPAYLFRNEGGTNHSLRVKLVGTKSNRDGIGAVVKVVSGGSSESEMLKSGSSYLSANELVLTFGLAQNAKATGIEIRWPSGHLDYLKNISAGQTITVKEGRGIVAAKPFQKD
ncbi:MAG TPA: CRTAC1 family protein [Candidatus Acidoferrales bacterium]|nr:CRTAC1 family protein [Candidatus Acidoferrales bacterium]